MENKGKNRQEKKAKSTVFVANEGKQRPEQLTAKGIQDIMLWLSNKPR